MSSGSSAVVADTAAGVSAVGVGGAVAGSASSGPVSACASATGSRPGGLGTDRGADAGTSRQVAVSGSSGGAWPGAARRAGLPAAPWAGALSAPGGVMSAAGSGGAVSAGAPPGAASRAAVAGVVAGRVVVGCAGGWAGALFGRVLAAGLALVLAAGFVARAPAAAVLDRVLAVVTREGAADWLVPLSGAGEPPWSRSPGAAWAAR